MSWFEASGLANIAKSALKEAQRTIDKALDIREDEINPVPVNTPVATNNEDFFGNWGLTQSANLPTRKDSIESKGANKLQTSIWGSFTGSFFETKDQVKSNSSNSFESLEDSTDENFSKSKLVVHSDDGEQFSRISSDADEETLVENNSESVELITCSTEYTTSPESEVLTPGVSASTSSSVKQQTSESVEILANVCSSPSPSSVEVLGFSEIQDEFASPLQSPIVEEIAEKSSPESVEVIQEDQEEDTMSYTSISESTSVTVLDSNFNLNLKPQKLKDTYNRPTDIEEVSPETITQVPKRCNMHLTLRDVNQVNQQVLINTQPQSIKQDLTNILTNVIDIPPENPDLSLDETKSDKTLIASDGLIESSSDTESSNSSYLKNLIADAMVEKIVPEQVGEQPQTVRVNSPHSSESRSDLVKIESISDHTSAGDDLETTTSSDIEIISSPGNGDSSSTQSRQSPLKQNFPKIKDDTGLYKASVVKKAKGHNRELSEGSSISEDEIERLLKRLSEMTEILESRESKLIDVNRKNAELQEINDDIKTQLDTILLKQLTNVDVSQVTEEYTQRLSALEKKFQQTIREKDTLRKQLETAKQDAATRLSKTEFDSVVSEKEEVIKELREEGEKLSKQQLQHSNIIKKLRAKEKENEATIKNLKDSLENQSSDNERLKRSLVAKEEVERTQIDAIHQLTTKNKKLETELEKTKSQLDDLSQKYDTVKKSLDAAKKELVDKNRANSELAIREQLLESLENEKKLALTQNSEIMNQLEDLRAKLRQSEQEYAKKENILRVENNELLRRLEDVESRNQELSQSVLEVSKPLVRQLEQLQAAHSFKIATYEKMEQQMTLKTGELQSRLQTSTNSERLLKEDCISLRGKLSDLEAQFNSLKHKNEMVIMQLDQFRTEAQILEQDLKRRLNESQELLKLEKEKNSELSKEIKILEQQQKVIDMETKSGGFPARQNSPQTRSNSPTLSLGKVSVAESLNSSFWSQEEPFEVTSAPRYTNMFEMQMLQTSLKQRDGEVQQLQWELNRREQERSLLNSEISNLVTKIEALENQLKDLLPVKTKFQEVQQQYDTLCQLYGEKVEENEELKLDLLDVKDMYKSQIDELLKQQQNQS